MDPSTLALAVDDLVWRPPSEREEGARLYGVVVRDGVEALTVRLVEHGEPRRVLRRTRLPGGLTAAALAVTGWRAPLADPGDVPIRPSEHPLRQRVHSTCVVYGGGDLVSVLRTAGTDPRGAVEVLPGGVGVVPDLLRHCWWRARAREAGRPAADGAPWAVGGSTSGGA